MTGIQQQIKTAKVAAAFASVSFLILVVLVVRSPHRFVYDEPYFVAYVGLLHEYGLTAAFLTHLIGGPGPLCSFFQFLFEPLTQLQPVGMRLVNVLLLLLTAVTLAVQLRGEPLLDRWATAGAVLSVPMAWVIGGLALSEIAAVLFVTLSLCLQSTALDRLRQNRPFVPWYAASAVCLGIACWGRQPYVLLCGVPVLAAILDRRLVRAAFVFVSVVCAVVLPLFFVWRGLCPPAEQYKWEQGISVTHCVVSFGYLGICVLLLAPNCRWLPMKLVLALASASVGINLLFGFMLLRPLNTSATRHLSVGLLAVYERLCGAFVLSLGVLCFAAILLQAWENRSDLQQFSLYAGLLIVGASPLLMSAQYSSRYTAMALPYLVLSARPVQYWNMQRLVTGAVGCALGALSLWGYISV